MKRCLNLKSLWFHPVDESKNEDIFIMAVRVVEFSSGRYKIRKILAEESINPKEIIEF